MPLQESDEGRTQEGCKNARVPRCRIPQRLPSNKSRTPTPKAKTVTMAEQNKPKFEVAAFQMLQHTRFTPTKPSRPHSGESRPKSGSRSKDESPGKYSHGTLRVTRPDRDRLSPPPRKPFTTYKKPVEHKGKAVISGPVPQRLTRFKKQNGLPDQETIKKREELEVESELDVIEILNEYNDKDMLGSQGDKLKLCWQEKINLFDNMKKDLNERQKAILELYATLRNTHKKMTDLGQRPNLPSAEDLRIMNVAKMTPDQLLQLCAGTRNPDEFKRISKTSLTIDMNKLYNTPTKLVATCEQTLAKRKEIIDWFEKIKTEEKGISTNKLTKKINEFNAENEMLSQTLHTVKGEFLKELNEIVDYLRRGLNETIALQLRTEELMYELSELNSQNADLKKQLHAVDHLKSQHNKHRVEELEKELKEEKCKKMVIRDRLSRAEGQIKIGTERASQLEATLEQARSQNWALERTVQQLHEQNQKLQVDFDKELNKLTESIRENTLHLEEIAEAREKLQAEKEDLEKRLRELSENYNESLLNMKHELNNNVTKLIETENKYEEEKEDKIKLEAKLKAICDQVMETESRYKEAIRELQEKDTQLNLAMNFQRELEVTKQDLEIANSEVEDYRNRLMKQNDTIREIERNFKETIAMEKTLKCDLNNKEEYISELEKKQELLEKQLRESEIKMQSYEKQLSTLQKQITQLQEEFGEFENLNELNEKISEQRSNLREATRKNSELMNELQKKEIELEQHLEHLSEQESLLEQRDGVIKMLSEKEEEQANIIKLLRNNLEMRAQADSNLNHQVIEKNAEIESLITNVETRKQQISQLEKIILTLEDQLRKVNFQRRKDQEKISMLEKTINEYENYHMEAKRSIEAPADNLDNLIKILEEELGGGYDYKIGKDQDCNNKFKKTILEDRNKRDKQDKYNLLQGYDINSPKYQADQEKTPTKIVLGNYVKKTHINNDDQCKVDNLDRKKAITNIDTQKSQPASEPATQVFAEPPAFNTNASAYRGTAVTSPLLHSKEQYIMKNLQYLTSNQLRDEKKCKMFKLAGHRLQN